MRKNLLSCHLPLQLPPIFFFYIFQFSNEIYPLNISDLLMWWKMHDNSLVWIWFPFSEVHKLTKTVARKGVTWTLQSFSCLFSHCFKLLVILSYEYYYSIIDQIFEEHFFVNHFDKINTSNFAEKGEGVTKTPKFHFDLLHILLYTSLSQCKLIKS